MTPIKKNVCVIFLIGILFSWHLHNIGPKNTYALDSFVKLVQTVSIQKNDFQSEELVYLAKPFDLASSLQPLPTFTIRVKEKFLSPFSVDFAAINAILLSFLDKSHLPYVCLFFSILTLLIFTFTKDISITTLILASLGTPLVYQGLEYSENSILLLTQSLALYFYFKERNHKDRFLTGLFFSLGIFFRLESMVFIGILFLVQLIVIYRLDFKKFLRTESIRILGISLPLLLFLIQNLLLYDHMLGARFLSNQSTLSDFHFIERLVQARNLIFLAYFKIGFFGFTPIFFLSMGYLFMKKNIMDNKDKVLLFTLIFYIPMIAFIAPNDGVTNWGARYMNLAILPSLFLFNSFQRESEASSKKLFRIGFYFLIGYSILILLLGLKFQQVATKEIRLFQEDITKNQQDLHILGAETIGLYSGIHYFEQPMVLPKNAEVLDNFLSKNREPLGEGKKILLSRIRTNPTVKEGIKVGLFPPETHYESLLTVLRKHFKKEEEIEGKKLIFHVFSNP